MWTNVCVGTFRKPCRCNESRTHVWSEKALQCAFLKMCFKMKFQYTSWFTSIKTVMEEFWMCEICAPSRHWSQHASLQIPKLTRAVSSEFPAVGWGTGVFWWILSAPSAPVALLKSCKWHSERGFSSEFRHRYVEGNYCSANVSLSFPLQGAIITMPWNLPHMKFNYFSY